MNITDMFSTSQRVRFQEQLSSMPGKNNFDKLLNFQRHVVRQSRVQKNASINDKLETSRFLYLPGEASEEDVQNCMDHSLEVLLASLELCPELNPRLIMVDQESAGIHYIPVVQTKEGLFDIDPSYDTCGPLSFDGNSIVIRNLNNSENTSQFEHNGFEFFTLDDLLPTIAHLRTPRGIVDFLSDSGQRVEIKYDIPMPYEAFLYVKDNHLVGELRVAGLHPSFKGILFRNTFDFSGTRKGFFISLHSGGHWRETGDEVELYSRDFERDTHTFSTLKKMGQRVSKSLFIQAQYLGNIFDLMQSRKKAFPNMFCYDRRFLKRELKEYFDSDKEEDYWLNYLSSFGDNFQQRFMDFSIYKNSCLYEFRKAGLDVNHLRRQCKYNAEGLIQEVSGAYMRLIGITKSNPFRKSIQLFSEQQTK